LHGRNNEGFRLSKRYSSVCPLKEALPEERTKKQRERKRERTGEEESPLQGESKATFPERLHEKKAGLAASRPSEYKGEILLVCCW